MKGLVLIIFLFCMTHTFINAQGFNEGPMPQDNYKQGTKPENRGQYGNDQAGKNQGFSQGQKGQRRRDGCDKGPRRGQGQMQGNESGQMYEQDSQDYGQRGVAGQFNQGQTDRRPPPPPRGYFRQETSQNNQYGGQEI